MLDTARSAVVGTDQRVDLSLLIHEIIDVLSAASLQSGATLRERVEPGLAVRARRAELYTVFWNLIENALEASPNGGVVTIRARSDGQRVHVEIADQGPGVAVEIRERIFDPYFTTKDTGTGLGLALVQRALSSMNGTLTLLPSRRGACFSVELERAAQTIPPASGPADDPDLSSGVVTRGQSHGAKILVVDDDRAMRELLVTTLQLEGAQVVAAGSAEEALGHAGPFDLALIDMALEDLRGDELLAALRGAEMVVHTALVSGSEPGPTLAPGGRPDAWIRKPFEIEHLLETVRDLLGRSRVEADVG
jgi:CheY-like chemotaxis protein